MKLISLIVQGQNRIAYLDAKRDDMCFVLEPGQGWPVDMKQLIASSDLFERLHDQQEDLPHGKIHALADVEILAPISAVEKLICIGTNYADHARELGGEPPEMPVVFNKFPSTIIGPHAEIRLPTISQKVDFEAELVIVIGLPGRNIPREKALDHVFGYCCGMDITAHDWQKGKPGGQWLLGKTFDTFAPLGPAIVTRDEIPNPQRLDIQLRLNGQAMQDSNTSQLIFPVDHLIAHISRFVTLMPGDLIFTGTPAGVGAGRNPPVFLKPGDQLEVAIQGLGVLVNPVIADS